MPPGRSDLALAPQNKHQYSRQTSSTAVAGRIRPPRLYVYFDAIIRHGSIRGAAKALHIASSALNRRVLDLEQEIGTILFDRLQSGVRLTAAGEAFAAHVRRTLNDLDRFGDQLRGLQGLVSGHVAIAAPESAAVELVPGVVAAFQRKHPGVRFTVSVGVPRSMLSDLLEDRVDMILTHEQPDHADIAVLAAAANSFCALMHPDHPLAAQPRLQLRDCQDFPIVLADSALAGRSLIESTLAKTSSQFAPVLTTNMVEVMKQYVRNSHAICFQFRIGPATEQPGDLVAKPLSDPELSKTSLMLATRRSRVLPPAAASFCEKLRVLLQETAAL
jgi:DNA-binding transcriptional LysR family regulator